jgi:hypothetical protein
MESSAGLRNVLHSLYIAMSSGNPDFVESF